EDRQSGGRGERGAPGQHPRDRVPPLLVALDLLPHAPLPRGIGVLRTHQLERAHDLAARLVLAAAIQAVIAVRIRAPLLDEQDALVPITFTSHDTPPMTGARNLELTHRRSAFNARATRC